MFMKLSDKATEKTITRNQAKRSQEDREKMFHVKILSDKRSVVE